MSSISINAKNEENDRLKEYIQMEQAKLKESKRFLEEDQKKFFKLIEDSKQAAKDAEDQVKQKQFDKN